MVGRKRISPVEFRRGAKLERRADDVAIPSVVPPPEKHTEDRGERQGTSKNHSEMELSFC